MSIAIARQQPLPMRPSRNVLSSRASSCRPVKALPRPAPLAPAPQRLVQDEFGVVQPKVGAAGGGKLGFGCAEIPPTRVPRAGLTVSAFQHIGDRKTQEDRFTIVPTLEPESRSSCSFFGVFDGTVGDFASENVKDLVIPKLLESPNFRALRQANAGKADRDQASADKERLAEATLRDMYRTVDEALLVRCAKHCQHYATCTSVTVFIMGDLLVIGHLGDSRIVIGKEEDQSREWGKPALIGEQVTEDHKPDLEKERERIEACGGSVVRLQNHCNKPFIRGGDFMMRKALGEQPMQLQYSRAFGAKDLKMFGLSNEPDIRTLRIGSPAYRRVRYIILASDGLWDVVSAQQAVRLADQAVQADQNPAEALVRHALLEQSRNKVRADNITAICVQLD